MIKNKIGDILKDKDCGNTEIIHEFLENGLTRLFCIETGSLKDVFVSQEYYDFIDDKKAYNPAFCVGFGIAFTTSKYYTSKDGAIEDLTVTAMEIKWPASPYFWIVS